jgi:hypothetical protein
VIGTRLHTATDSAGRFNESRLGGGTYILEVRAVGYCVYRSPSEAPAEFLKADSQCGVIAIWTKSGP